MNYKILNSTCVCLDKFTSLVVSFSKTAKILCMRVKVFRIKYITSLSQFWENPHLDEIDQKDV